MRETPKTSDGVHIPVFLFEHDPGFVSDQTALTGDAEFVREIVVDTGDYFQFHAVIVH